MPPNFLENPKAPPAIQFITCPLPGNIYAIAAHSHRNHNHTPFSSPSFRPSPPLSHPCTFLRRAVLATRQSHHPNNYCKSLILDFSAPQKQNFLPNIVVEVITTSTTPARPRAGVVHFQRKWQTDGQSDIYFDQSSARGRDL